MDHMRFTAASQNSPLADVIVRALAENGELSVTNMRAPGFRALAPLLDKAQVLIDKAIIEVGLQRLTVAADVLAEGLTFPLSDPLSVTQIEWSKQAKIGNAQRSMQPTARTENKAPIVLPTRLPVYLTMDGFELDIRTLRMSERVGTPLDTSMIKQTTRAVNESIEDAFINGATTLDGQTLSDAGYSCPGLLNAPNLNNISNTVDWTAAPVLDTTGPAMLADVQAAVSALQLKNKFGPYNLYVGTKAGVNMTADFKQYSGVTIQQRLEQLEFGGRNLRVRIADMMPGATTGVQFVLVQMTEDVIQIVDGQRPTVIPWTSLDGFTIHNLVMAIQIPRVRSDYNGQSGVCTGTKS